MNKPRRAMAGNIARRYSRGSMETEYQNRMEGEMQKRGPGRPRKHKVWGSVVDEYPVQCPNCGSQKTRVVRKENLSPRAVKRMRECENCKMRIPTMQYIKPVDRG